MEETRKPFWRTCATTPRDKRNQRRVLLWMFAWMSTWVAATQGIRSGWLSGAGWVVGAVLVSTACGLGMGLAYRRFLREADELLRKIELEALALTVGVGLVGGLAYWTLALAGVISEASIPGVVVLMVFTHTFAVIAGLRRYA